MSDHRRPLPPDDVLAEIAARHRVTVQALILEWEYPSPYRPYQNIEEAAAGAYRTRKGIEAVATRYAESHMEKLRRLAQDHGVTVQQIIAERRIGDWPDDESAARHLARQRAERPNWVERLKALFHS